MEDLLAARLQMAISLGWHIIFACFGMAMPFFMAFAEWRWMRTGDPVSLDLAKYWSKGVAIFFTVGAVSGTFLSFELGLLWPKFMLHAGPLIGMPFSMEGTAFFLEAIALGIFLYGWNRVPKLVHWISGIVVGVAGVLSGIFVVAVNGWMNYPTGFDYIDGRFQNIDPIAALFNPMWFPQALHMTFAAFASTGFAVAGLHAILVLRGHRLELHRQAIRISLLFGAIAAFAMPFTGDFAAKQVAKTQPAKLAAMESHFQTSTHAPLAIGGIPDVDARELKYAIEIPGMLSFLAHGNTAAEVTGLNDIPRNEWPPVAPTHIAFQVMVAFGVLMLLIALVYFFLRVKKKTMLFNSNWLWLLALCTPIGFIALEAGWTVTEVGRQPWIINGIMRTSDAVTPMPGIRYTVWLVILLYAFLTAVVIWLMSRMIRSVHNQYEMKNTGT